jgi:hypothetical protein
MRRLLVPVMCLSLFAAASCGESGGQPPPAGSEADGGSDSSTGAGSGQVDDVVPDCPVTAAEISDRVGVALAEDVSCVFRDGTGVALATIYPASRAAGEMTYDYERQQADEVYERVIDLEVGDRSFIAVKEIEGKAYLVSAAGSYLVVLSSFDLDLTGYEQVLRDILDHILG